MTALTTAIDRASSRLIGSVRSLSETWHRAPPRGVEFGECSLCLVRLKGRRGAEGICRGVFRSLGPDYPFGDRQSISWWTSALREMRAGVHWGEHEAVASLPGHAVDTIPLRVEAPDRESLTREVGRQAAEHLTYPVQEAVADYIPVDDPDGPGRSKRVILVAARREAVDFALEVLDGAGFAPSALELPITALARLHREITPHPQRGALLVSPADTATSVAYVHEGRVLVARVIPWGISRPVSLLEKALGVPRTEAQKVLSRPYPGWSPGGETNASRRVTRVLSELVTPVLEELATEVGRVWTYACSEFRQSPAEEVHLAGGAAFMPAIAVFLSDNLGLPVSFMDPTKRFPWRIASQATLSPLHPVVLAVGTGLALREMPCPRRN